MKRRGNDRFHVVSTWNPRGVFVGFLKVKLIFILVLQIDFAITSSKGILVVRFPNLWQ